ncbi:hypothetical protein [Exiguobacterium antarcticum]|nr:hypothetical protein [Exiguobacterium antarcticum]
MAISKSNARHESKLIPRATNPTAKKYVMFVDETVILQTPTI